MDAGEGKTMIALASIAVGAGAFCALVLFPDVRPGYQLVLTALLLLCILGAATGLI